MLRRGDRTIAWPLRCPVCGSLAVRDRRMDLVRPTAVRCCVCCGACETWRAVVLAPHEALLAGNRLGLALRRDRRRIARTARRAATGRARDWDAALRELVVAAARADRLVPPA